jgi:hypothetical protein
MYKMHNLEKNGMRLVNINGTSYECDDYRQILNIFTPEILSLIIEYTKEDKRIQKSFLGRLITIDKVIKTTGKFEVREDNATFFDIMFDAMENNESAQKLLEFIDNCIKEITLSITDASRNKIKNIVLDMVINFNEKQSCFYSRVAELAYLWKILKIGKLKIKEIEKKLPNGKSVDIVIEYNNCDYFLDIVSIFLKARRICSDDDMYNFLYGRIAAKYQEKFQGLEDEFLKRAGVMPVLWGELKDFKQNEAALEKLISEYKNQIIPPYGLVYLERKKERKKGYYFELIKHIIHLSRIFSHQ